MASPQPVETAPDTPSGPAAHPRRRLSDKIQAAIEQAAKQGRREIEKRLSLIHDAVVEEEAQVARRRRIDD